jgi:DNA-binding LacI/PurR family transcriptional regulator
VGVTSAEVARRAGVSRATVSLILNGHGERFAASTRERVEQAARELRYQPSAAGRTLARGASDFIIALIPNTTFGTNLQDLFEKVTEELAARGLTLVLRLSTRSAPSLDAVVAGMSPRAVLSLGPFTDAERSVLAAREVPGFDPTVAGDLNVYIGQLQAEHLIQRGYRRLAFAHLRDARRDPYGKGREAGVRAACRAHKLPAPTILGLGLKLDDAAAALTKVQPGHGVACYNDDVAITLLTAAGRRGWRVPDDIGLVGMDHTPLSQVTNPRLTTVGYNVAAVAHNVVTAALNALGETAESAYADIDLRLIAGETT